MLEQKKTRAQKKEVTSCDSELEKEEYGEKGWSGTERPLAENDWYVDVPVYKEIASILDDSKLRCKGIG